MSRVPTNEQLADIVTKALGMNQFQHIISKLVRKDHLEGDIRKDHLR